MLEIDGSFGEGGGQIIRTSVTLAAITGQAVHVTNVRAKRQRPGLQPQHLAAVQAIAQICGAELVGGAVGSTEFAFSPGSAPAAGSYFFDIGTAGSAPLVLQTVLLPLALSCAPSRVRIVGGTYNPHAPSGDYLQRVFLPIISRMGLQAELTVPEAGYYPRGGGVLECAIEPAKQLSPIRLIDRGSLEKVEGYVVTSSLPSSVGERGAGVITDFAKKEGLDLDLHQLDLRSRGTGAAVLLVASCANGRGGFLSIGERGKPMERVTGEACNACKAWLASGAACDEHLADQLVLPSVLAAGESSWTTPRVSEHLSTVIWVVRQFVDVEIVVEEPAVGSTQVKVTPRSKVL